MTSITPLEPGAMTLFDHFNELRARLVKSALGVVVGTIIGMIVAPQVIAYLQQPYGRAFTVLGPTGSVVAYFRVALMIGAILAVPLVTYQGLMFVIPGLKARERRLIFRAIPATTLLFLIGAAFAWFVLTPPALGFLAGFQPTLFEPEWTADLYLGFVTALIFWMGVAFETPLVFFILALLGIVTPQALIQNWRIAIVVAAVAAALITPTVDPVNMALVMGPLLVLYVLSIFLVAVGGRIYRRGVQ